MKIIGPFLILISICSILAWDVGDDPSTKLSTIDHEVYEALLAEKDEEIRNLRAALAVAKQNLVGTTKILQQARTIDLRAVSGRRRLFRKIKEKFFEKAAKIKAQLKKIATMLNEKRRRFRSRVKRLFGSEKLYTYKTI